MTQQPNSFAFVQRWQNPLLSWFSARFQSLPSLPPHLACFLTPSYQRSHRAPRFHLPHLRRPQRSLLRRRPPQCHPRLFSLHYLPCLLPPPPPPRALSSNAHRRSSCARRLAIFPPSQTLASLPQAPAASAPHALPWHSTPAPPRNPPCPARTRPAPTPRAQTRALAAIAAIAPPTLTRSRSALQPSSAWTSSRRASASCAAAAPSSTAGVCPRLSCARAIAET
mmetsp:Transcript_6940/g.18598  ORF Transcript_6940/g.18598 Transcript_6940/m.18598 type:complete len:224 (+) Transcript_6940:88-759(+)